MVMPFNNISKNDLLLSNSGVATFLKQTKMISQQKYEAVKFTISSVTPLHAVVFASTKSDSFIQIFLLGL